MASSFFAELKRRNVYKVCVAYLVLAWVVVQVTSATVPALHLPEWINSAVFLFGAIGFPFALFFAWEFELTPDGVKRESDVAPEESITTLTGRKLDFAIIGLLAVALTYFIYESRFASYSDQALATDAVSSNDNSPTDKQHTSSGSSIAVLPFVNLSSDKEQEYFSDGLSEELLNLLAKIPQLRVIARTSSFSFKGEKIDIADVAKKLNVSHVLEGSVRKSGNTLRITAQLIRASDSSHIWSETYDRQMTDVLTVQDEIAKAVVAALKLKLLQKQELTIGDNKTISTEAYNLYLRGRSLMNIRGKKNLNQALTLLEAATVIDENFSDAYAAKAIILSVILNYDYVWSKEEVVAQGEEAIAKALLLDDNNVDAIVARAIMQFFVKMDWREAEGNLKRALQLMPNNVTVHNFLGDYYTFTLNADKALYHELRARELDPLNLLHVFDLAQAYGAKGNRTKQIELLYSSLDFPVSPDHLTLELLADGKMDEAETLWTRVERSNADIDPLHISAMRACIDMVRHSTQSYDTLPQVIADALTQKAFLNVFVGRAYLIRGDIDNALKYYHKSYLTGEAYIRHVNFNGSREHYPNHQGWQAFWDLPGMKALEEIRRENATSGSARQSVP